MAERLTADQRATAMSALLIGNTLDDFAARHPDWPQDDLRGYWVAVKAEIDSTTLEPGQVWATASEWQ